jgi:glucan phosphorylase
VPDTAPVVTLSPRDWHPEVIDIFRELDPAAWRLTNHNRMARMKRSITSLPWRYNAARMVRDYVTRAYLRTAGGLTAS